MHGFGMGFGGWLIPLVIIGIFFYWLLKDNHKKPDRSAAQDILDKRYANGGIDKEEYEEKSKHLKEHA
jgi:putative membrane protein